MDYDHQDHAKTGRYVTDEETQRSIDTWLNSASARPDIFIVAPSIRDVGEQRLIEQLADASYRLGKYEDLRRRHFILRSFSSMGSEDYYARFLDETFATAEITDEFYGVDAIDLTQWLHKEFDQAQSPWHYLIAHITAHPETDFVFIAYTDEPEEAMRIAGRITIDTGIGLQTIQLKSPNAHLLASEFLQQSEGEFSHHDAYIGEQFDALASRGMQMNYGFARSCALYALHQLSVYDDKDKALAKAFARYNEMSVIPNRARTVGFI